MKKFLFVLCIFFVCGILSEDIILPKLDIAVQQVERYQDYANARLKFSDVIWGVIYARLKLLAGVVVLSFLAFRRTLGMVIASVFSYFWGFFLMNCIQLLGMAGIVIGVTAVLPQGLFYGAGIVLLLLKKENRSFVRRENLVKRVGVGLFVLLLFLTGCVIESLMGTHMIPWVIRLSMI